MGAPIGRFLIALVLACAAAACDGDQDPGPRSSADDCSTEIVTTDSGLRYEDLECGDGPEAESGQTVAVHYTGTLENGEEFDSSRGGDPYEFVLGAREVIEGWDEGIEGMRVGGVRVLTIPPELASGAAVFPNVGIPPDATLIFEVELVDVTSS